MRKLKPMEQMLTHLLRVGKCKYFSGSMATHIQTEYILGNINWLNNLFLSGLIQTEKGPYDPKHPSGNMYINMPNGGEKIFLTAKGKEKAERLARIEKR